MLYFLITFVIMAASILLVYRAARFVGLKVSRWALVLCGVLAVIVNFASIALSMYLTLDHLAVVIVLVFVAAALVTGFNEYLLRRGQQAAMAGGLAIDLSLEEPSPASETSSEDEATAETEGPETEESVAGAPVAEEPAAEESGEAMAAEPEAPVEEEPAAAEAP